MRVTKPTRPSVITSTTYVFYYLIAFTLLYLLYSMSREHKHYETLRVRMVRPYEANTYQGMQRGHEAKTMVYTTYAH